MKVLFLDVDGVLVLTSKSGNKMQTTIGGKTYGTSALLAHDQLLRLREVALDTHLQIVISSDWRRELPLMRLLGTTFAKYEIPDWIGTLPVHKVDDDKEYHRYNSELRSRTRTAEINEWLSNHRVSRWAALDDTPLYFGSRFFQTDPTEGLTQPIAVRLHEYFK